MLVYLDFIFALLEITVWSKFTHTQIGWKFASPRRRAAGDIVLRFLVF